MVPETIGSISATSESQFTILCRNVHEILLLNKFFSDCRYVPYLRGYSPTNLCDGAQMAIFGDFVRPVFPACSVQHVSDLRLKFTLSMANIQSATAEIRRGIKKHRKKIEETTGQKYNERSCYAGRS